MSELQSDLLIRHSPSSPSPPPSPSSSSSSSPPPTSPTPRSRLSFLIRASRSYRAAGDTDSALAAALAALPHPLAHLQAALAHSAAHRPGRALAHTTTALSSTSGPPRPPSLWAALHATAATAAAAAGASEVALAHATAASSVLGSSRQQALTTTMVAANVAAGKNGAALQVARSRGVLNSHVSPPLAANIATALSQGGASTPAAQWAGLSLSTFSLNIFPGPFAAAATVAGDAYLAAGNREAALEAYRDAQQAAPGTFRLGARAIAAAESPEQILALATQAIASSDTPSPLPLSFALTVSKAAVKVSGWKEGLKWAKKALPEAWWEVTVLAAVVGKSKLAMRAALAAPTDTPPRWRARAIGVAAAAAGSLNLAADSWSAARTGINASSHPDEFIATTNAAGALAAAAGEARLAYTHFRAASAVRRSAPHGAAAAALTLEWTGERWRNRAFEASEACRGQPVSPEAVRAALPANVALVAWVLVQAPTPLSVVEEEAVRVMGSGTVESHVPLLTCWLFTASAPMRLIEVDGRAVDAAAERFKATATASTPHEAERALRAASKALEVPQILDAIPSHINRVVFVPHGPVIALPVHALPVPPSCLPVEAQGCEVLDRFPAGVSYSPSVAEAIRPADGDSLVRPSCAVLTEALDAGPVPLPHSAVEVAALTVLLTQANVETDVVSAPDRSTLLKALNRPSPWMWHYAGHAESDGLVVFGSHHVTTNDIASIDGDKCVLMTLSACGTGELAMANAGAALKSGARAAVVSLWPVADESTAALMSKFYELLLAPNIAAPPARALIWAQSWMRARGAKPRGGGTATGAVPASVTVRGGSGAVRPGMARWDAPFHWAPWIVVTAGIGKSMSARTAPGPGNTTPRGVRFSDVEGDSSDDVSSIASSRRITRHRRSRSVSSVTSSLSGLSVKSLGSAGSTEFHEWIDRVAEEDRRLGLTDGETSDEDLPDDDGRIDLLVMEARTLLGDADLDDPDYSPLSKGKRRQSFRQWLATTKPQWEDRAGAEAAASAFANIKLLYLVS